MKKVLKKIASVTMAFTLLGTGTVVTKIVSPKSDTTIIASAASCPRCHDTYHAKKTRTVKWREAGINSIKTYEYTETYCPHCGYVYSRK